MQRRSSIVLAVLALVAAGVLVYVLAFDRGAWMPSSAGTTDPPRETSGETREARPQEPPSSLPDR